MKAMKIGHEGRVDGDKAQKWWSTRLLADATANQQLLTRATKGR